MLAMVHALGVYRIAEVLRQNAVKELAGTRKQFIRAATLRLAIGAVIIALSIGQQTVEGVRRLATLEHVADFIDRVIALAQFDDQLATCRLLGLRARPWLRLHEKARVLFAAEVMAHHLKRTRAVAESASSFRRWHFVDEKGTKGFVLTLTSTGRFEEEAAALLGAPIGICGL